MMGVGKRAATGMEKIEHTLSCCRAHEIKICFFQTIDIVMSLLIEIGGDAIA